MHHHAACINQRPLTFREAFNTQDLCTRFFELFENVFRDALNMAVTGTGTDDQEICVTRERTHIDDDDVLRFALEHPIGNLTG